MIEIQINIMSQIIENLFLGDMFDAHDDFFLKKNNITHILNCANELKPNKETYISNNLKGYYKINLIDKPEAKHASDYIIEGASKIHSWLEKGHIVHVHCAAGVSRSASVVIAYLIIYKNLKFGEAYAYVKDKRDIIEPNEGFKKILHNIGKHK